MLKIEIANTTNHFLKIETLADVIWREHYIPIVGKPQIDYMLEKFQSVKPIALQVESGYAYYILNFKGVSVGYISIKKETDTLFLSKLYVLANYRGHKIGKSAMAFIESKAKSYKFNKIRLTVNINNTNAIKAYEKLGFKNMGPLVADIGGGFVMDDFEMVKVL